MNGVFATRENAGSLDGTGSRGGPVTNEQSAGLLLPNRMSAAPG